MAEPEQASGPERVRIGAAHGAAFAVAIAAADVLRSRGAVPVVAGLHRRGRATAVNDGTVDLLVDYVESDAEGLPKQPAEPGSLLAAFTIGYMLAVPSSDRNPARTDGDLRDYLTEATAVPEPQIVTEIPPQDRKPITVALREHAGIGLSDEAFITVPDSRARRHLLDSGRATAALVTTTDATLSGLAHHAWRIPTETTYRVVAHTIDLSTSHTELLETLLAGLTVEVMRELAYHIGDTVMQSGSDPATPTAVAELTERVLRDT